MLPTQGFGQDTGLVTQGFGWPLKIKTGGFNIIIDSMNVIVDAELIIEIDEPIVVQPSLEIP